MLKNFKSKSKPKFKSILKIRNLKKKNLNQKKTKTRFPQIKGD